MRAFFLSFMCAVLSAAATSTGIPGADWHGAQWIGAGHAMPLYPQYLSVFNISCTISGDSDKAAVIFGANDMRLAKPHLNRWHLRRGYGESYVAVELDSKANKVRLIRRGYTPAEDLPTILAEADYIPDGSKHKIDIRCNIGNTDIYIDDHKILSRNINPYCRGGNNADFNAAPVLADPALCSDGNLSVENLTVSNFRAPGATLFNTGELSVAAGDTTFIQPDIVAQPLLRSAIRVKSPIKKASLKATARGIYNAKINGRPVSADYFAPGASQYNRTHFYDTIDITEFLHPGLNDFEVQLSEGWWCGQATYSSEFWNFYGDRPSFLSDIVLEYTDGTTETIPSLASEWECSTDGPVLAGSFFHGEVLDAQKESAAKSWHPAVQIPLDGTIPGKSNGVWPMPDDYSDWSIVPAYGPAVTAVDTLQAISVTEISPNVYIYDMGQNFAGVPLLTLRSTHPGTEMNMRFAEVLYPDTEKYDGNRGEMMMENIRSAMAQDIYITRGDSLEIFSPRSTFHGYRYVEISGIDRPLPLSDVKGVALSSIPRFTASFECSDSSVNRLWKNILWSTRSNFISIPTDCPQRNERMGWSGDIGVFAASANYLADADLFLRRHMQAMRDCQRPDGRFPDIAPTGFGFGGLLWGSAGIVIPYECFRHYADTTILAENYPAMQKYIDYTVNRCIDPATGLLVQFRQWGELGDWLSPEDGRNDKSLIWEAYHINNLRMMAESARALGHYDDAEAYETMRAKRMELFRKVYIDPDSHKTRFSAYVPDKEGSEVDTQISYVLPIAFGIVDPSDNPEFVDNFLATLRRTSTADDGRQCPPNSLMTGFIGTARIMHALSMCGAADDAYSLLTSHNYPSWLYPVDQGATTIWERLNSYTIADGFGNNNSMNSFNHYSFGAVAHWLMSVCGGIRTPDDANGFTEFVLEPIVDPRPDGLSHATASYELPQGTIVSSWQKKDGKVCYTFEVPEGCKASLRLPGKKQKTLKSGKHKFTI